MSRNHFQATHGIASTVTTRMMHGLSKAEVLRDMLLRHPLGLWIIHVHVRPRILGSRLSM